MNITFQLAIIISFLDVNLEDHGEQILDYDNGKSFLTILPFKSKTYILTRFK